MKLSSCWAAAALLMAFLTPLPAQISNVLTVIAPEKIAGKRNEIVTADFQLQLRNGFHVNSNTPSESYLIPLKLTFTGGPVETESVDFPKPQLQKYEFSSKPLSVFTGDFRTKARFKILPAAPLGQSFITGKLRYQACNHSACLPPKTIDLKLPVEVRN